MSITRHVLEPLLTIEDVSIGPASFKLGRDIRYELAEVRRWVGSCGMCIGLRIQEAESSTAVSGDLAA